MYATCRHVMPSGLRCQSPALRGSAFCYHHGRRIPPARTSPSAEHRIEIAATLDRSGIAHSLASVLQSLADGRISARRASVLLWGIRTAAERPADFVPPPAAEDPSLFPEQLFALLGDSEEAASLVNMLAVKLGLAPLDAPSASPDSNS